MELEREDLKRRLEVGESLEIFTGGGSYEVWTEPYANPPLVFFEGRPLPYGDLEGVIDSILSALERGEVACRWVESQGMQVKSCEETYRRRAGLRYEIDR